MRSRNIKPGFFRNECLADCDPLSRLLFAGLWCLADKAGKFEWRPRRIKADILPYDDCEVERLLGDLVRCGFIEHYAINGTEYGRVTNFRQHQRPHHTEKDSALPDPNPDDNTPLTVNSPLGDGENPPDSLIPDSLIPDSDTPIGVSRDAKASPCPQKDIISAYHTIRPELPRMNVWTPTDEKHLRARWRSDKKYQSLDWWKRLFEYIGECPWLMGENDRAWQADLRWMVKADNFAKIASGKYGRKKKTFSQIVTEEEGNSGDS